MFLWKTLKWIRNIPYIIILLPLSVFHKNTMVLVSSSASSTKTQWFAASSSTSSTRAHACGLLPPSSFNHMLRLGCLCCLLQSTRTHHGRNLENLSKNQPSIIKRAAAHYQKGDRGHEASLPIAVPSQRWLFDESEEIWYWGAADLWQICFSNNFLSSFFVAHDSWMSLLFSVAFDCCIASSSLDV